MVWTVTARPTNRTASGLSGRGPSRRVFRKPFRHRVETTVGTETCFRVSVVDMGLGE